MDEQLKKKIERMELAIRHGSANALPEDYQNGVRRNSNRPYFGYKLIQNLRVDQRNRAEKTHA